MKNDQINPQLIQQLTGTEMAEIPEWPSKTLLTGNYAEIIDRDKDKMKGHFGENKFTLTCKDCGKKGKYDVGLMCVNADAENPEEDPENIVQTTGYFRCQHCNKAGNWKMPASFLMKSITGMVAAQAPFSNNKCEIGKILLYDGSWLLFASDAEDYLLEKLRENPGDAFIWNRLGNLYDKGGRPELAACAFEHSLTVDPEQIESHYTLGGYFFEMEAYEKAAYHYKEMLVCAGGYDKISAEDLRNMLSSGLQDLFKMNQQTNGEITLIPTRDEMEARGKLPAFNGSRNMKMNLEIYSDDQRSFYPVAESFMGKRNKEIPKRLRALKTASPVKKKRKRHKRSKR